MSLFRDIDKIDDLMADITEQQDVAREISDAISRPFGDEFDEVDTFHSTFINISFSGLHSLFSELLSINHKSLIVFPGTMPLTDL